MGNETELAVCYHCGNRVPLKRTGYQRGQQLYEHDGVTRYNEDFDYELYQCPTCQGISIFGDFSAYPKYERMEDKRIHPRGSSLAPERHMVASRDCIPAKILKVYEEIWPLRHIAPNAFAGQIRRALEFVCKDKKAEGKNLFQQLKHLVEQGTFPGYFTEITDLMRQVGNLGAHAEDEDIDFWDAELLDDFFRSVIEYVYVHCRPIARRKAALEADGRRRRGRELVRAHS